MKKLFFALLLVNTFVAHAYDRDEFKAHAVKTAQVAGKLVWAAGMTAVGAAAAFIAVAVPVVSYVDTANIKNVSFSGSITTQRSYVPWYSLDGEGKISSHTISINDVNLFPVQCMAVGGISVLSAFGSYKAFKSAYLTLLSISQ